MNVSADYASPAAIRPMLYGRSPRRSFIYSSADPQLRICRCPGACSTYIRVRIRGIRIFILRSMLFSHPTIFIRASAAAIFCQPMLSASAFARRSVPDKQYPTVDARSSVTLREPRHFRSKAVISRSCYFPKPSFPEAVISRSCHFPELSIIIGKDTVDDIAHSELTLSVGRVGGMLRAGTVGCGDTRLAARQSAIRICICAAGLHRAFPACGIAGITKCIRRACLACCGTVCP